MFAANNEVIDMINNKSFNFDTLRYVNKLKSVGVSEKQAEMQAELQAEAASMQIDVINNNLATKEDINELKRDIKEVSGELNEVKNELKRDIKEGDLMLDSKIENVRNELKLLIAKTGNKTIVITGAMIAASIAILDFLIKLH